MNLLRNFKLHTGIMALAGTLLLAGAGQASTGPNLPRTGLEKAVRHELVMLPYYNIFDNLAYRVDGGHVTLYGEVTRPTLRHDAERAVRHIEGVESVENRIEVLPVSFFDDHARRAVARAIYGYGPLQRYRLNPVPSIHIIVKNGNVTLEGVVANQGDSNIANIRANSVPGVFTVTNHLVVEKKS